MLCGKQIDMKDPVTVIHERERRESYVDFNFLLLCKECGDKTIEPIRETIRRRYASA
jgi:hypothetical protein